MKSVEVCIVGGGVTGAGILLDCISRGIKACLLEQNDFASGTSSKSTKLIHGGLRYLKNMEFGLVRELGIERATVHRMAPHLTIPEPMLTPFVKGGTYGKWLTSVGISMYDYLAKVPKKEQKRMLTKAQSLEIEPLLDPNSILGSALYYEYRTDDARLTYGLIKTSLNHGAEAYNYCKVNKIDAVDNGYIVHYEDVVSKESKQLNAKIVVNAAGPWADRAWSASEKLLGNKSLYLTKGVHIVLSASTLPVRQAVYFDGPDKRMIFAIPRGNITYVGTTDTHIDTLPEEAKTSFADIDYLLAAVKHAFPTISAQRSDVLSTWVGVRPLIYQQGKTASEISRKDEIFVSPKGIVSIAGGKLTGFRKMAEKVTDLIQKKLNFGTTDCKTARIKLSGGEDFHSYTDVQKLMDSLSQRYPTLEYPTTNWVNRLVHLYGHEAELILKSALQEGGAEAALLKAEFQYVVTTENCCSLVDALELRMALLYFDPGLATQYSEKWSIWYEELAIERSFSIQEQKDKLQQKFSELYINK